MSLPAALTWLQLFPRGTHCFCATGPEWFRQMLMSRADGAKPAALAIWGKTWNDVNLELPKWDRLVAINCPHVTTARLEGAGYTYARRFAVLPSLEKARWFVSLDSGPVAAASFSLYTPARRSAHLKKAVAKLLARCRVPGWYRDEVIVASRTAPPLEAKLAELFPGQTIRLALSSGAPEPAINRKPSASVIDARGNVLGFVKIEASTVSRKIVEHEAEMLVALEQRNSLQLATPRLVFAGEVDGRYMAVQSPLQGTPAPSAITKEHAAFLLSLRCGAQKSAAETNMVASLAPRIASLHPPRPNLRAALDAILPTLAQMRITAAIVHGDFAPWNLRTHHGKLSAFDWEYGELDGLPLVDEIHFRLQLGLEMEKWDLAAAARFMNEQFAPDMDADERRAVGAVYLLDHLARLYGEGYAREHDMISMYEDLLTRLNIPQPQSLAPVPAPTTPQSPPPPPQSSQSREEAALV